MHVTVMHAQTSSTYGIARMLSTFIFGHSMVGIRAFYEDPANEAVRDFETLLPTVRPSHGCEKPLTSAHKRYRSRFTTG